jgi:hypothetical protein
MRRLFSRRTAKKASLEISVQAIVIVVLAMTLLGLGLGFVRNLFTDISSTTEDVQAQVKQRILDDLITNDRKLSFPKTEIRIDKGAAEVLSIGLRNKNDIELKYYLDFKFISVPPNSDPELASTTYKDVLNLPAASDLWFQFDKSETTLESAGSSVRNIRLNVPANMNINIDGDPDLEDINIVQGSYALSFRIFQIVGVKDAVAGVTPAAGEAATDLDKIYDQKDLFIVVKG